MRPIIKIFRHWQDPKETLGSCTVLGKDNLPLFVSLNLERGWRNNEPNVSCIPRDTMK